MGISRTKEIPKKYSRSSVSTSPTYNKIYVGIIKEVYDGEKMGRLKIWIPELSSNPEDATIVASYASPFAGASNLNDLQSTSKSGQTSYGWWGVPPDINNEVLVCFANSDPNQAYWFACLYQQYMNNMVPGIPEVSIISNDPNKPNTGPASEYNKKDPNQNQSTDPQRPGYQPLIQALTNQGLYFDDIRGQSTSGARRETPSTVQGILSPGGNQFVIDDNDDNKFIRLRTQNGTQVLINDTTGIIYMVSRNGNSWVEISDDGLDYYTSGKISMRSHDDINFHSDGNINMMAVKGININSANDIKIGAATSINTVAGNQFNVQSNGMMNLISGADTNIASGGALGINAAETLALQGAGSIGVTSCGSLMLMAKNIQQNTKRGPTPNSPGTVKSLNLNQTPDRELNKDSGYPEIRTSTNVSRLPTHEPFSGHPSQLTKVTTSGINLKVSERIEQGDSGVVPPASKMDTSADAPVDDTSTTIPTSNDDNWWVPTSGRVSAPFGDRSDSVHKSGHPGCDIAAPKGSNIVASRSGKVIWAAMGYPGSGYGGYGNCVAIDHGDGYKSIYGHMSQINVGRGNKVSQGQTIGLVGSTGFSTGNHCHFEIRKNSALVSPASFLPQLGIKNNHVTVGGKPSTSPSSVKA